MLEVELVQNSTLQVDVSAISKNLDCFRQKLGPSTQIMAVVKADAYGVGVKTLAPYLEQQGIGHFAVAFAKEGLDLRQLGMSQDILVINAREWEIPLCLDHRLSLALSDLSMAQSLARQACSQGKTARVHLHLNTGFNRFGCHHHEAEALADFIHGHPNLLFEGLMSHLSAPENPDLDDHSRRQWEIFEGFRKALEQKGIIPRWVHLASSGAVCRFEFPNCNMARIGLGLFGAHPSLASRRSLPLQAALTLKVKVVGFNDCEKGDTVSYSCTYRVPQPKARIATLALGYHDGMHRHYSGLGTVQIRGKPAPMVGHICMDYMMVDVSQIPECQIGDWAVVFGGGDGEPRLEDFAISVGSCSHALSACLGPRVSREYS